MKDFSEEQFEMMCNFSLSTANAEYGKRRAAYLGFESEGVRVGPGAIINNVPKEQIGENVLIGMYSYVNGDVTIGKNVLIGPHCCIAAGNHKFDPSTGWFSARTEADGDDQIIIGENSWLANSVTITAGVKLGKGNLVCAGAVVTKSTDDYSIMAGIPARKVGFINPETGEYIWNK